MQRGADKRSRGFCFPNSKAAIPVLLEDGGQLDWIHWGRRKEEPVGLSHESLVSCK